MPAPTKPAGTGRTAWPKIPARVFTVRVYLAGGVPEVMLHLRALGLLHEDAMTAACAPLGATLDWWAASERRRCLRE